MIDLIKIEKSGLIININTRKPHLANNTGGLSGPAIKPVAVRMVYQVSQAVDIPILGMGGIINGDDAVEFMLARSISNFNRCWKFHRSIYKCKHSKRNRGIYEEK